MTRNKTEQAQQLRLAAELIETGHPFEFRTEDVWLRAITATAEHAICERRKIRPILATPPDGRPLHNPDNLTAEQVGVGYRLCLPADTCDQPFDYWLQSSKSWEKGVARSGTFEHVASTLFTYRLPLSVPWPEAPKPDPYAELKAAHAAGKVIQQFGHGSGDWFDCGHGIAWNRSVECYRIKPEPFQLPPPPIGMKWHREDGWKEGDLPQGYRPLVYNERRKNEDEWAYDDVWRLVANYGPEGEVGKGAAKHRTTRPLIFTHGGKEWTYHRPGDPMPCDGEVLIEAVYGAYCDFRKAKDYNWDAWTSVFGWRYAETNRQMGCKRMGTVL